ncbi:MAG TPA: hypothetical protein VFF69_14160 [Phycisphaerales bacterium]|nr:hypothetical protein [Phycisphaerales bacterium]
MDETILAALVEGDLGSREADVVRERLLAADPDLAARVELMERDRVMLRALGDETPPTGLAESVVARLERDALLGLSGGADHVSMPVSVVRPGRTRGTGIAGWMTSPAGAGLAMAAVLALAVGVTLQLTGGPRGAPLGGSGRPVEGNPLMGEPSLAQHEPAPEPRVLGEAPAAPEQQPIALAAEDAPEPVLERVFTDDPDRALALLAEGRLLVRVRAAAPDAAAAELARLAERPARPNEAFRIAADVPDPIVLAMESRYAPAAGEPGPVEFASSEPSHRAAPDRPDVREPTSMLEAVYLADARLDASALASLRHALALGDGKTAEFEELPEPLDLPGVLTPDAVLWWARDPSEWSRRGYVPVVIERVER